MTTNKFISILIAGIVCVSAHNVFAAEIETDGNSYIWWEGENPDSTNFPEETFFSATTFPEKRSGLSGSDWLTNDGPQIGNSAYAKYSIDVPFDGEFDLWCRKFWQHGPFKWRFDVQGWQICDANVALADTFSIREFLCANWVYLGKVKLAKGNRSFELELLAEEGENKTSCFDCFVLTSKGSSFEPRGKLKPGEISGNADPGFFPWEPARDAFEKDTVILNLSYLNEETAGESGFLKSDGDIFRLGNGKPVRFWGANIGKRTAALDHNSIDYLAKHLAKVGVNMLRYHSLPANGTNVESLPIDSKRLDDLFFLVSSMKEQGIYTYVSFYFPLWVKRDGKTPFAHLFIDPQMQSIYKSWAKEIFTTVNPYTGISLADDPAVAIVEIINEDNYFFWTFTKGLVGEKYWRVLELSYTQWLTAKYGSLENAFNEWGHGEDGDSILSATLYDVWHITSEGFKASSKSKQKRLRDQAQFLTEHQKKFFEDMKKYFREELGIKSLISASNWHTADPKTLDALERYTYTAGDVIDRHGYFGAFHEGDGSSYLVKNGHTFDNKAAVNYPKDLPILFMQTGGFPNMISEIGWTNPNLYRADYSFLVAAYGALQGTDAYFTFAIDSASWERSMKKFAMTCPVIMGNFPAYALLYRRGDVSEGDIVVSEVLKTEELWNFKDSGGFFSMALDKFRQEDVPDNAQMKQFGAIDPLSCYVGRVVRSFGKQENISNATDLTKYIDPEAKTIKSITGELSWNYKQGVVTLNTPRAQGAAGFLKSNGRTELGDIVIKSQNAYGTVIVISLDDLPLRTARRILIQVMTIERPYGFKSSDGLLKGGTITDMGGAPVGVEKINASIAFKTGQDDKLSITPLDLNGYPRADVVQSSRTVDSIQFQLLSDAVYYVVER